MNSFTEHMNKFTQAKFYPNTNTQYQTTQSQTTQYSNSGSNIIYYNGSTPTPRLYDSQGGSITVSYLTNPNKCYR